MRLRVNISPCPNDTFMFEAMLNGRVDTEGLEFDVRFADIEELNRTCMETDTDVCKASYAIWPTISDRYGALDSGSALGRGNGPLLVSRNGKIPDKHTRLAIPGEHTTANLLIKKFFPELDHRTPLLFSEIADRVASGEFDAGVLIHEGRFTYREKGLERVADLGEVWEENTGLPLPLGGIFISNNVSPEVRRAAERVLRRSIEYALNHPEASTGFVRSHAREMEAGVLKNHISLFVNDYSLSLGPEGRRAVKELTGVPLDKWKKWIV